MVTPHPEPPQRVLAESNFLSVIGTIVCGMTYQARLSKIIHAVTIVFIAAAGLLIRLNHINLRATLNRWERQERQLHQAPSSTTQQN